MAIRVRWSAQGCKSCGGGRTWRSPRRGARGRMPSRRPSEQEEEDDDDDDDDDDGGRSNLTDGVWSNRRQRKIQQKIIYRWQNRSVVSAFQNWQVSPGSNVKRSKVKRVTVARSKVKSLPR
eukprot:2543589-Rhodomonas_salina.2